MRGMLIVVEGLDGTGKTSVAQALADRLDGVYLTTPDASLRQVRGAVDEAFAEDPVSAQLFYAASVLKASRTASTQLREGRDVVLDRYWISTIVSARLRGEWADLCELGRRLIPADVTFLLELPEEERRRRLALRGATRLDLQTLDPRTALALRTGYRTALRLPIAGVARSLDVGGLTMAGVVNTLEELVERRRSQLTASSAFLRARCVFA